MVPKPRGPSLGRPQLRHAALEPVHLNGDLAYAVSWGDSDATSEVAVVDLRSGRVLSTRRGLPPYLLLGEDRAAC